MAENKKNIRDLEIALLRKKTTGNRDVVVKSMIEFVTGNNTMTQAPTLYDIHFCKHSNIGIADFIGWQVKVGK